MFGYIRSRKGRRSKHGPVLPVAAVLCAAVAAAVPARAAASQHPYRLVDPGTFGGPQSFRNLPAVPLTRQGGLLGTADTAIPDADDTNPFVVGFPTPTWCTPLSGGPAG
jgi:hypothetical protein